MVILHTAEQVAYYMSTTISLSRYDGKFIDNIQQLKQVTTNQVELFNKIIYKYRRQFAINELDVEVLINLPWKCQVIDSSPSFTDGYLAIDKGMIIFKCPYQRNFIEAFRKEPNNNFVWNKVAKQYEHKFGTQPLKMLYKIAGKFFKSMQHCAVTAEILDTLKEFEGITHWQPTLMRVNGNLLIAASNEWLDAAISDIKLNTDLVTLAILAHYGITIDTSLYDASQPKEYFMANYCPKIETIDVSNIIPWLTELGCTHVYFSETQLKYRETIMDDLAKAGITCSIINGKTDNNTETRFPVSIRSRSSGQKTRDPIKVVKNIQLVNSQPINIK
ncbi:MAG: hypothetical protein ACOVLB_03970 [Candidatus Nanopelagicus sp.]